MLVWCVVGQTSGRQMNGDLIHGHMDDSDFGQFVYMYEVRLVYFIMFNICISMAISSSGTKS